MSAIGVGIFSNDMAMDVKYDFCQLLGVGKTIDEINEYILGYKPDDDDEEACAFWSALAMISWQYGMLTGDIKAKAKYIIEKHDDSELFFKKSDKDARKTVLQDLIDVLETENPKPKKRKKTFVYRTTWKQGDILALPVNGRYMYLHICSVKRRTRKIKELESDSVCAKLIGIISDQVFDISFFTPEKLSQLGYANFSPDSVCTVQKIWCSGIREQQAFEKKITYVGNTPTEYETATGVSIYGQFSAIEDTILSMYNIAKKGTNNIFNAIRNSEIETVRTILTSNPEKVNSIAKHPPKVDDGKSLLQIALDAGHLDIVDYLLDLNADVNYMEPDDCCHEPRMPVLHYAIRVAVGNCRRNSENYDENRKGPLSTAAKATKAYNILVRVLDHGADITVKDSRGITSLERAVIDARRILPDGDYTTSESGESVKISDELRADLSRIFSLLLSRGANLQCPCVISGKPIVEQYAEEPVAEFFSVPNQNVKKDPFWKKLFRG